LPTLESVQLCGFLPNQICRFQENTYFVTPFGLLKQCLTCELHFSLALRGYFFNSTVILKNKNQSNHG
jgi:hypothetical protein